MVWPVDGKKYLKICLFVLTEFTNMMDRQTPHDSIGCVEQRNTCHQYTISHWLS